MRSDLTPAPVHNLVLLSGLLCDATLWDAPCAALSDCKIAVPNLTDQATIAAMAQTVLAASPARFSLAGFSLGSQVALEIMRLAPERVERSALLSATHGGLLPPVEAAIRRAMALVAEDQLDQYLENAFPTYVSRSHCSDPTLKQHFLEMAHSVGAAAGIRQMEALLAITSPFDHLSAIGCPTLIIGGAEDQRTTPAAHEQLASEIHGSELVIIPDAGHFTLLEQPSTVAEHLKRWLHFT